VPLGLAESNIGQITDMICCPGLDYCSLANARSIPLSQTLTELIHAHPRFHDLGPLSLKISGCINACGHHHIADIGLLGVDKQGEEFYQILLGGALMRRPASAPLLARPYDSKKSARRLCGYWIIIWRCALAETKPLGP